MAASAMLSVKSSNTEMRSENQTRCNYCCSSFNELVRGFKAAVCLPRESRTTNRLLHWIEPGELKNSFDSNHDPQDKHQQLSELSIIIHQDKITFAVTFRWTYRSRILSRCLKTFRTLAWTYMPETSVSERSLLKPFFHGEVILCLCLLHVI